MATVGEQMYSNFNENKTFYNSLGVPLEVAPFLVATHEVISVDQNGKISTYKQLTSSITTPITPIIPINKEINFDFGNVKLDNNPPISVNELSDISGKNRNASQTLKTKQPIYKVNSINGKAGATFGSGRNLVTTNFFDATWNKSFTSFTVSKMAAQNAICVPYSVTNTGGTYQHWTQRSGSNDNFLAWSVGISGTDGIKTVSMYHKPRADGAAIEMFDYNGSVRTIRVGYLEQKTWSIGDLNIVNGLTIGSREGGQYPFIGDINATQILKGSTQDEQNKIIDELNDKYQIYTNDDKKYFGKVVVCFDGHSIANGWNTEGALMKNYANKVIQALGSGTFWNTAMPAKDTIYLNNQALARVDSIFTKKTYPENGITKNMNNILVYYEATNSINLQKLSGLQTFNNVKMYCLARKAVNPELKIVLIPCGPIAPTPKSTPEETEIERLKVERYETERLDYNARILTAFNAGETWINGYPRVDLDDRINIWNAIFYNNSSGADYVHPNSTGHQIIADILLPVLLGLITI